MTTNPHASAYLNRPDDQPTWEAFYALAADAKYRGALLDQVRELDFKVFLRAVELVSKRSAT